MLCPAACTVAAPSLAHSDCWEMVQLQPATRSACTEKPLGKPSIRSLQSQDPIFLDCGRPTSRTLQRAEMLSRSPECIPGLDLRWHAGLGRTPPQTRGDNPCKQSRSRSAPLWCVQVACRDPEPRHHDTDRLNPSWTHHSLWRSKLERSSQPQAARRSLPHTGAILAIVRAKINPSRIGICTRRLDQYRRQYQQRLSRCALAA